MGAGTHRRPRPLLPCRPHDISPKILQTVEKLKLMLHKVFYIPEQKHNITSSGTETHQKIHNLHAKIAKTP